MAWIDQHLENYIRQCFPKRKVHAYHKKGSWQSNRYIQVTTALCEDTDIHYEYYNDTVELHLEGKYQSNSYRYFAKELRIRTFQNMQLQWLEWQGHSQCRCRIALPTDNWGDLCKAFQGIMDIFDPIINDIEQKNTIDLHTEAYAGNTVFEEEGLEEDNVCLSVSPLGKLFGNSLIIPNYQRNYCWEDKQIKALWQSLQEIPQNSDYHLGTIILQKNNKGEYAIIDGQQRLVTLSLIAQELKYTGEIPLLKQKFLSENSRKHIANARWIIKHLALKNYDNLFCSRIINHLIFTVLILKESRLDLAYTFFSNENAKGIPLSDYDLLKAHHLRYIFIEEQAEHLAGKWNKTIENDYPSLDRTLASHLFRLRKWMRKQDYNPDERLRVKEEFSSALILPEIPAFGEQFNFYEKIQGGAHFFAYTEHFVNLFKDFSSTPQVKSLRNHLQYESHWRYADVIESLLFGYYLKFGKQYLTESLYCIASNIAQHRYGATRAIPNKIREYARNSEITMMIDQASSPTFFLAECSSTIKIFGRDIEEQGIALRFFQHLRDIFSELSSLFTDTTIINKYNNEYA